ncbi:hypothetical protein ISCGN_030106 [Ixodes scapularis]
MEIASVARLTPVGGLQECRNRPVNLVHKVFRIAAGAAAGLAQVQQWRSRPSCLTSLRFSGPCLDPAGGQPSLWHVCLPRRDACEPWQARSQCLGSGAGSKSRFRSMDECRHVCAAAGKSSCLPFDESCRCTGDYRIVNYVHSEAVGCRRLAQHRCVSVDQGFASRSLCRHKCGFHRRGNANSSRDSRCFLKARPRPCSWRDKLFRFYWDGAACRPWDSAVCPQGAYGDPDTCSANCP